MSLPGGETALIAGCGLRIAYPPPHPRPLPLLPPPSSPLLSSPLPNFASLCSSGQCGMLKRDLEEGGGGEDQPPSSTWEGQGLRGRGIPRGGRGRSDRRCPGFGRLPGTLQVWVVKKPKDLVRTWEHGLRNPRPKVSASHSRNFHPLQASCALDDPKSPGAPRAHWLLL